MPEQDVAQVPSLYPWAFVSPTPPQGHDIMGGLAQAWPPGRNAFPLSVPRFSASLSWNWHLYQAKPAMGISDRSDRSLKGPMC